jgi:hypothetical protein
MDLCLLFDLKAETRPPGGADWNFGSEISNLATMNPPRVWFT